jgi:hypothetical protein
MGVEKTRYRKYRLYTNNPLEVSPLELCRFTYLQEGES